MSLIELLCLFLGPRDVDPPDCAVFYLITTDILGPFNGALLPVCLSIQLPILTRTTAYSPLCYR